MRRIFVLSVLLAVFGGACEPKGDAPSDAAAVLASVGKVNITRSMVDLHKKSLARVSIPERDVFSLAWLVQGYLAYVTANRDALVVSNVSSANYWDKQRPYFSPDLSDAVAAVPEELVLATFAKPQLAMTLMAEAFDASLLQPDQESYVFRTVREIQNAPGDIRKIAAQKEYPFEELWIGPSRIRMVNPPAGAPPEAFPQEKEVAAGLHKRLQNVRRGEILVPPVVTLRAIEIYRVEERKGDEIRVAVVSLPKPPFDDWFWSQVQAVPVVIPDAGLRKKFRGSVPWAQKLQSLQGQDSAVE